MHDTQRQQLKASTADPAVDAGQTRSAAAERPAPEAINSSTLLQGGRTVMISHNGASYRLQATRQGKLILTK